MIAALLICGARAGAQGARADTVLPRLAGARTIAGVVRDSSGQRADSVEVLIADLKMKTRTSADGTFRFDGIEPGEYKLSARRLGYLPQVRSVTVAESGGSVAFEIVPIGHLLAPVVTTSARGGLSGVVADTAYQPIADADIWLVASSHRATSDSSGRFFMDVRPGSYMMRVSRTGYGSRMVSVKVPDDSGRRVVVWLAPSRYSAREQTVAREFSERLLRRNPMWSRLFTREDIVRGGYADLSQIAVAGAQKAVDESCDAIIDGGMRALPIWALSAADVEYVEVYVQKPPRNAPRSINTSAITRSRVDQECSTTVYAWLRK